jgi:hypothetical protein
VFDPNAYDDSYGTCQQTSAAFRIWHVDLHPAHISQQLGLLPSWSYQCGAPRSSPNGRLLLPYKFGIWGFATEGKVQSRDLRRHLDWLLDHLAPAAVLLHQWQSEGYRTDVFCNWVRLGGTGGPTLSPRNMVRLAQLNLELGFEWWSVDEPDDADDA